ncbi:MAG: 3-phosphoshikimate 1-carboxyvinyltransferase [Verrucomicrobiales bacterium]|nr:3-phosphoshikimate 1-carboxyvinyltransferase [Verrucomicrobiales bacterium]
METAGINDQFRVMALPEIIEIKPVSRREETVSLTIPGSKSLTNRYLIAAALGDGRIELRSALWSEDTEVMVNCLGRLGFELSVAPDPNEPSNRTIAIKGQGGVIPKGGDASNPLELFVGNAGTAARFLTAFLCLGSGVYRLSGVPRMHERPQQALFSSLRGLGYRLDSATDQLPVVIHGGGARPGKCKVSIAKSSQFASALLLAGGKGGWSVEIQGENEEESSYVEMTRVVCDQIHRLGKNGGVIEVEADASSASYFVGADWLLGGRPKIKIDNWPQRSTQLDARFPEYLPLPGRVSRRLDLGDSIMTAIVMAPFSLQPVEFSDLGRLRVQECERVVALRTELARCGAQITETGDSLKIVPGVLHGAEIETYNDHRMAMCFATLGLKISGIKIKNPSCVKKTFPNFFQKLGNGVEGGIGAEITDAKTGKILEQEELFAD